MVGRSPQEARQSLLDRGLAADEADALAPHLVMPGSRPNSILSMEALTPRSLGALLSLYEHRTYCSGQLWGINPFDQWGVELGKDIGTRVLAGMNGTNGDGEDGDLDSATRRLMTRWREAQA